MKEYLRGLRYGIPIALGYLSVSFTFGIMAISYGMTWWQAVMISMLTLTSAGQLAGIGVMIHPGQYIEMLISQITINIRYSFMSISLSQKLDDRFRGFYRWVLGFAMTDEIFAVASTEQKVGVPFFAGLATLPYLGWTFGTLLGALLGNVLPQSLMSALGIAMYGMFVAIVVPEMKNRHTVLIVAMIALVLSCMFYFVPILNQISSGLAISICAVLAALAGAVFFPVEEEA